MKRSLFLLALSVFASSTACAAVGDTVNTSKYVADGVSVSGFGTGYGVGASVDSINSTRFYDSNKGGYWTNSPNPPNHKETDNNMCWTHVATNSIQYWQDVYGVFYKDTGNKAATSSDETRILQNGYCGTTTTTTDYDTIINGQYAKIEITDVRDVKIAKVFFDNWPNTGGYFGDATDWYFKKDASYVSSGSASTGYPDEDYFMYKNTTSQGGYFSEYFGTGNSNTPASHITVVSQSIEDINPSNTLTSSDYTPFKDDDLSVYTTYLLAGFGLEQQEDNSFKQNQEGLLPAISIKYNDANGNINGHILNCYGFTTGTDGNLVSILVADGDDYKISLKELYVKVSDGKIYIYTDAKCTTAYSTQNKEQFYIGGISYINTPQVLQNMLSEYRDINEAAIWNGGSSEWSTQVDVIDSEIADSSTGWDIYVDGSTGKDIAEAHHGYYHGYALEGRKVEFGDHANADKRNVSIVGEVSSSSITISAEGYSFTKGSDNAAIKAGADMTVRSGASLSSELKLQLNNLTLEAGSTLKAIEPIVVTGDFVASAVETSVYTTRATVAPEVNILSALDLREADSITLQATVNMNGNNLYLSEGAKFYISQQNEGDEIAAFTNIGKLYLGDSMTESYIINAEVYYAGSETPIEYLLVYNQQLGSLSFVNSIPEPTTATLSLLALTALVGRRRRR